MLFIKKFRFFSMKKTTLYTRILYCWFHFFTRNCSIEKIKIVAILNVNKKIFKEILKNKLYFDNFCYKMK